MSKACFLPVFIIWGLCCGQNGLDRNDRGCRFGVEIYHPCEELGVHLGKRIRKTPKKVILLGIQLLLGKVLYFAAILLHTVKLGTKQNHTSPNYMKELPWRAALLLRKRPPDIKPS